MRSALIIGAGGQDGRLLTRLLDDHKYAVRGWVRPEPATSGVNKCTGGDGGMLPARTIILCGLFARIRKTSDRMAERANAFLTVLCLRHFKSGRHSVLPIIS